MRVEDITPALRERLGAVRYDRIIEKHEGPWDWADEFTYDEGVFVVADGRDVLLPIPRENAPNVRVERAILSADGQVITLFVRDTTWYGDDPFASGYVAIAELVPGETWYLTLVYHEWFASATLTLADL